MRIITRAEWGARPPKNRVTTSPSNRVYYVVHHSGGPVTQTVRAIQDWCMDGRGFADIDYNFLVRGSTGEIYEGRGWDVVGAHTTGFNTSGVGVCIIGTDQCSDAAKVATRWLYAQYNQRCMKTLKIRGHRDLATTGTDCPGDRNYAWVHAGMPAPTTPEDDVLKDEQIVIGDSAKPLFEAGRDSAPASEWLSLAAINGYRASAAAAALAAAVAQVNTLTAGILANVKADDGEKAAILADAKAKHAEILAAVSQVDEQVWAKVPDPGISAEETANLLRPLLGDKAAAVGALLAA